MPAASGRTLRVWLVDLFAFLNLGFLSLDIFLAHSSNEFASPWEWLPIPFAVVALLLWPSLRYPQDHPHGRKLGYVAAWLSISLGLLGLFLHLHSSFFEERTIKSLVYTAPFVAPLSYVGVGLLLLLNRMELNRAAWGSWILLLAGGGFVGNLALSLLDHAQNAFFYPAEWISVIAAAFGASFLLVLVTRPEDRQLRWWCSIVMVLQALVGVLGSALHIAADLRGPSMSLYEQLVYGTPVFAPLLFTNLALLAAIGLWDLAAQSQAAKQ